MAATDNDPIDAKFGKTLREGEVVRDAMIALKAFDSAAIMRDLLTMARKWMDSQRAQKDV